MILRNAIITEMNLSKAANKPPVESIKFRFDLTVELAEQMGWDCLFDADRKPTNGWDTLPLKGDLALVKAKFKPNKKGTLGEITATTASHFAAHRVKEKDEGGTTFYLSAILRSADETFEQVMGAYWRGQGEGASQLTLSEAQANLFTGATDGEQEGPPLRGEALDAHVETVKEILKGRKAN